MTVMAMTRMTLCQLKSVEGKTSMVACVLNLTHCCQNIQRKSLFPKHLCQKATANSSVFKNSAECLHSLSILLQTFLNVVDDLHSCLWDSGPRPKDTAHPTLVQELIVLMRKREREKVRGLSWNMNFTQPYKQIQRYSGLPSDKSNNTINVMQHLYATCI